MEYPTSVTTSLMVPATQRKPHTGGVPGADRSDVVRLLSDARKFMQRAYRILADLDTDNDGSIQYMQQLWNDQSAITSRIMTTLQTDAYALTVDEEAQLLLTVLLGQQVGIRNHEPSYTAIERAYDLLSDIHDTHLVAHLLVALYVETQDPDLLHEARQHIATWSPDTLTPDDQHLLRYMQHQD